MKEKRLLFFGGGPPAGPSGVPDEGGERVPGEDFKSELYASTLVSH